MITETTPVTVQLQPGDSIENFIELVAKSGRFLIEAGGMLSRLVANDPQAVQKILDQEPTFPGGLITNLLRVGERSLHPDLLLNNCLAYRKLRCLPYSTQAQLLAAGSVEVVVNVETGDTLRVPLTELSGPQAAQVLARDGIRSRDDQRAWLKRRQVATMGPTKPDAAAWFVKKDRLIVTRPTEMSKGELLAAMAELVG